MFQWKKSKGVFIALIALSLMVGLFAQSALAAKKVITWNYHTAYDKSYFNGGSHVQAWADKVWEETNGQLKINIYYNGTLGYRGDEIMAALRDGLLESAEFSAALNKVETGKEWWSFNDFYALFDNWEQLLAVDKVANPIMEQEIKEFGGVVPLAFFPCGPKVGFEGIWMNKEIKKWSDFKGTKIRIFFDLARRYVFDELGFATMFLPGPETYQGLQTGLVDGAIQSEQAGYTNNYYEIAKYFYAFEPIIGSWWGLLCSQKAFDALPEDVQAGLIRASKEHKRFLEEEVWMNQSDFCPGPGGILSAKDCIKFFQDKGNVIVRVPLLMKKIQDQNMIGLKEWINSLDKYNAEKANLMLETLLKAKQDHPGLDQPAFMSLDEWVIEDN